MAEERTLDNFIAKVKNDGLARASRFNVILTPPAGFANGSFIDRDMILLCDHIDIPSTSLATNDINIYGEVRAMPYQRMYGETRISFYVDRDMTIKKFFDRWINLIINPKTRIQNYYDNYASTMEAVVNTVEEKATYKIVYNECYPVSIDAVSLDYSSKDIMKLSVTMKYKYYEIHEFTSSVNYDFSKPIDISNYFSTNLQSAANYTTVQSLVNSRLSSPLSYGYTSNFVNSMLL